MKIILSQKISECSIDEVLLYNARRLQNGANVHCLANIMSSYIGACRMLNEKFSDRLLEIKERNENRLKQFVGSGGKCPS